MDKKVLQVMSSPNNSYETIAELFAETRDKGGNSVASPDFIVESFPRSANTFLVTALNMSWPNMAVQSHSHNSKHLTAANGLFPVVSIIRNPVDAIASCSVHLSVKEPEKAKNLTGLIDLYGDLVYCAQNNPNVFVIPFEKVTSDIVGTLDLIENRYGLEKRVHLSAENILAKTSELSKMVNQDDESFTKRGHVPREIHPLYAEIVEELKNPIYAKSLINVTKIYDSLMHDFYQSIKK
jgi:hypothetical protein